MHPSVNGPALIAEYQPYAVEIARTIGSKYRGAVDVGDLVGAAREGLLRAVERFEPDHRADFKTFAHRVVHGAVIDCLRRAHTADPRLRLRINAEGTCNDLALSVSVPDAAIDVEQTRADAAEKLGALLETVATHYALAEMAEALLGEESARAGADPYERAAAREGAERVRDAIAELDERERALVSSVYFDGISLEEAGRAIGVSKPWASRLLTRALGALRVRLSRRL